MNADEIVMDLKKMLPPQVDYAELVASPVPSSYGICYVWEDPEPYQISAAIDLIESLTAQLAKEEERRRKQAERLHAERSQKYDCFDVISDLKEQLASSQRRSDAAVEDMQLIAGDIGSPLTCAVCKYNPNDMGCELDGSQFDDAECHFEWRRAQPENKPLTNAQRIRSMSIGEAMNCPKCNSANIYTPAENLFICNRCGHEWQAEVEGRAVVLPCKVEPFDCQHCKHLSPSDKTNRLFCSYHGEGEHQYEVYLDDYCSNFERAEAEAAIQEGGQDDEQA